MLDEDNGCDRVGEFGFCEIKDIGNGFFDGLKKHFL